MIDKIVLNELITQHQKIKAIFMGSIVLGGVFGISVAKVLEKRKQEKYTLTKVEELVDAYSLMRAEIDGMKNDKKYTDTPHILTIKESDTRKDQSLAEIVTTAAFVSKKLSPAEMVAKLNEPIPFTLADPVFDSAIELSKKYTGTPYIVTSEDHFENAPAYEEIYGLFF